jgi:hypothetical protein
LLPSLKKWIRKTALEFIKVINKYGTYDDMIKQIETDIYNDKVTLDEIIVIIRNILDVGRFSENHCCIENIDDDDDNFKFTHFEKETVYDYIERKLELVNPEATKVNFRYNGVDKSMEIGEFLDIYGSRKCGLNGEIYREDDSINLNNYISCIY